MIEIVSIPAVAYFVAGLVKNTGLINPKLTPLVALMAGLAYGVVLSVSQGEGVANGLIIGTSGLLSTGLHEITKIANQKDDESTAKMVDLSNDELNAMGHEI